MNPVPAVPIEDELLVIGYGNSLRRDDGSFRPPAQRCWSDLSNESLSQS